MRAVLRSLLAPCFIALCLPSSAEEKKPAKPKKPVAGKADVLKHVRKKFAKFVSFDAADSSLRLHIEGEKDESTWPLLDDAEVKISGWWGRPEQLRSKDRVWVWFMVDRDKKPKAVLMIADEMSEQDIHDEPLEIKELKDGRVTVHVPGEKKVPTRDLRLADNYRGPREVGATIIAQTVGNILHESVTPEEFEKLRSKQQDWLREQWRTNGLPGAVSALHPLGGEMDIVLDHEAIRWGRYLKHGDKVTLQATRKISATVNVVRPWRDRTQVRLVTNSGLDQLDLTVGERISVTVPEPPKALQASHLPLDIGRLQLKEERVQWFLNTVYCSCGIAGDKCTGMYYTQASCNINACGMPKIVAADIREMIDKGLDDREIFATLEEEKGHDLWRPHLLR